MRGLAVLCGVLMLAATPASASSIEIYDAARSALLAVWAELPLSVRNVTTTDGPAAGYGNYTAHQGQSFAVGERIDVYVEVLGYGWKDNGDGTDSELLDADLSLIDANGASVANQPKFLTANIVSRQKLLETYLTLDARLTSFAPGDYTLRYTLHDRAGGKDVAFDVPITLVVPADASAPTPAPEASSAASSAGAQ